MGPAIGRPAMLMQATAYVGRRVSRWTWKLVTAVCLVAFGKAGFAYLDSVGIHLDTWMLRIMGFAVTPTAMEAMTWFLAAALAVLAVFAWEVFDLTTVVRGKLGYLPGEISTAQGATSKVDHTPAEHEPPKLICTANASEPGCVVRRKKVPTEGGGTIGATYFRLKVGIDRPGQIADCCARLV